MAADEATRPEGLKITKTDLLAGETVHGKFAYFIASAISSNGCHVAKVEGDRGKEVFVRRDGRRGKSYADIAHPVFSPDGTALAYAVRENEGSFHVINEEEGPVFRSVEPDTFVFSHDGKRHAYLARTTNGLVAVVDGVPQPQVEDDMVPWLRPPVFSADGSSVGYLVTSQARKKMRAVINGVPGEVFDGIGLESLIFSRDGERHAYSGNILDGNSRWCIVLDGEKEPRFDTVGVSFVFSPDGRRFAYTGQRDGQRFLVEAGVSETEIEGIVDHTLIFSPDSRRMAYAAAKPNRQCYLVLDGKPGPVFDSVGGSAPGELSRNRASAQTGYFLADRASSSILFSPDSRRVAYVAREGSTLRVYLDGSAEGVEMDFLVGWMLFSNDSSRLAYGGRRSSLFSFSGSPEDKFFLVVDGKKGEDYDMLSYYEFSPDGKHIAYTAKKANNSVIVLDGREIGEYGTVAAGPVFRADGILEFLAAEEPSLYRVEVTGYQTR